MTPAKLATSAATVQTSFPSLTAAHGEPVLPWLQEAHPAPGQVIQAKGPFDDRFVLEGTAFTGAAASGNIRITNDLSDLLELQIVAGFHDEKGALLGIGRFEHHAGAEVITTKALPRRPRSSPSTFPPTWSARPYQPFWVFPSS